MNPIIKSPWQYTLYEYGDQYILSVQCGSFAVFELNIRLTESEKKDYLEKGVEYINQLSRNVQANPGFYFSRNTEINI